MAVARGDVGRTALRVLCGTLSATMVTGTARYEVSPLMDIYTSTDFNIIFTFFLATLMAVGLWTLLQRAAGTMKRIFRFGVHTATVGVQTDVAPLSDKPPPNPPTRNFVQPGFSDTIFVTRNGGRWHTTVCRGIEGHERRELTPCMCCAGKLNMLTYVDN